MPTYTYDTFYQPDPQQQAMLAQYLDLMARQQAGGSMSGSMGAMTGGGGGRCVSPGSGGVDPSWGRKAATNAMTLMSMADKGKAGKAPSGFSGTGDGLDAAGNEVAGMASSGEAAGAGSSAMSY